MASRDSEAVSCSHPGSRAGLMDDVMPPNPLQDDPGQRPGPDDPPGPAHPRNHTPPFVADPPATLAPHDRPGPGPCRRKSPQARLTPLPPPLTPRLQATAMATIES